jgi:transcriptional regulator with XRE-family HTH domain
METLNIRIKEIRVDSGLNQEIFGQRIGLAKSSVSWVEKGKQGISENIIKNIINEFCVNEGWLKDGIGEKYNETLKHQNEMIEEELKSMTEELLTEKKAYYRCFYNKLSKEEQSEANSALTYIHNVLQCPDINENLYIKYYESFAVIMLSIYKFVSYLNGHESYSSPEFKDTIKEINHNLISIFKLYYPEANLILEPFDNSKQAAEEKIKVDDFTEHYNQTLTQIEVDNDEFELIKMYKEFSLDDREDVKKYFKFRTENSLGLKKKVMSSGLIRGEETITKKQA